MTDPTFHTIVHVAGEPVLDGLRQDCSRCGYVLHDYTGSEIAVLGEADDFTPSTFPVGQLVCVLDDPGVRAQIAISPDRIDPATDTECRPTS